MIEMNWLTAADRLAREASRWRKVLMNSGIHPEKRRELLAAVGDPERLDEELRRSGAGVEALRSFLQESTHLEPEEPTTGKIMDDCP